MSQEASVYRYGVIDGFWGLVLARGKKISIEIPAAATSPAAVAAAGVIGAAGAAAAGAWFVNPEPTVVAGVGVATALFGGLAVDLVARRQQMAALKKELKSLQSAHKTFETEVAMAKDGMLAVQQVLQEGGGQSQQRMSAMEDEVAVLQSLVARLQSDADDASEARKVERRSTYGMSDEALLGLVRSAVADGAVDLYLQPVVTLPQRRRRFYECLSRIPDQRGGVLTADAYVAAAESAGLIAPIDNLLLFRAVQLVRRAHSQNAQVGFFCNVSRHTLRDRGFLDDFVEFLKENAEIAPSLILEIAQADWTPHDPDATRYMETLAALGVRFSMDRVEDFEFDGALMRRRGFRFVKASASVLLEDDALDANRLKRRLAMNDMQLIVEKIEREKDLVELLEHDIDLGQGYLFGEPRAPIAATAAA